MLDGVLSGVSLAEWWDHVSWHRWPGNADGPTCSPTGSQLKQLLLSLLCFMQMVAAVGQHHAQH